MFTPSHCPHRDCVMHTKPIDRFFTRHGHFVAACRSHAVPRFKCRGCRRTFSRQTFRMDYRDHRPDLNQLTFVLLSSGLGLRRTARILGLTPRNLALKARKISKHCALLQRNAARELPLGATLQMDEFETYETRRNSRPLTLPVVIERRSRLILAARSAPIRPGGPKPRRRLRAIAEDESRLGRRPSRSRAAVRSVLKVAASVCQRLHSVVLETDEKSSYPKLARSVFGRRLVHLRTSSRLPRATWNPLFPINHTEAVARDLMGRLRRESWLVSKKRWFLNSHLHLYLAARNFASPRFNGESDSPAVHAGWLPRTLRHGEVLSWRQDFDERSPHPMSRRAVPWVAFRAR